MSLIRGDARFLPLADESIDCVVTSPPYWGLRDYKHAEQVGLEPTPGEYIDALVGVFREVRRVLKTRGTVWLNLGDGYAAGGKGGGGSFMAERREAAWQKRSTLNGWRRQPEGCKEKDLLGIPWAVAFALRDDGWYLRSDIIWSKPNPMPESITDRPTKSHEYLFLLSKSARYHYDAAAIAEPVSLAMLTEVEQGYDGLGLKDYEAAGVQNPSSVKARIIANTRARITGRGLGKEGQRQAYGSPQRSNSGGFPPKNILGNMSERGVTRTTEGLNLKSAYEKGNGLTRNKRTVWTIPTQPTPLAHFATMPEALVEPCILAGCPLGGRVLDPFVGSGTVVSVAERLGRRGVGVDLSYQDLARQRTRQRGISFDEVGT